MKVRLYSCDKPRRSDSRIFPNLALMKISTFWKSRGADVAWATEEEDLSDAMVYASKVFKYSDTPFWLPDHTIFGGTGVDPSIRLSENIDNVIPDYTLYPEWETPIGFLTRGCIRTCPGCIVPMKEGTLHPYRNIDEIAPAGSKVILMDNNVLACDHGLSQIQKIIDGKYTVDFNQGLDARCIDDGVARLLSRVSWAHPVRLACDSIGMMTPIRRAITHLRWHNCTPTRYFVYVLVNNVDEAVEIVKFLKGMNVDPFAQPYRDLNNPKHKPTDEQVRFARWVNRRAVYRKCSWEDYKNEKI